jgi:hypothetical protein
MAQQAGEEVAVRDFHIDVPEEDLVDFHRTEVRSRPLRRRTLTRKDTHD